jgi:RNA polymerase sigma factor (TIGR02999 family)
MSDGTRILSAIDAGDPQAAQQLLPLVYDELRKLASQRHAEEKPGQTIQATALVHEAYLRLVAVKNSHDWNGRGQFFAAAAEAMRRILVEQARRRGPASAAASPSENPSIPRKWPLPLRTTKSWPSMKPSTILPIPTRKRSRS